MNSQIWCLAVIALFTAGLVGCAGQTAKKEMKADMVRTGQTKASSSASAPAQKEATTKPSAAETQQKTQTTPKDHAESVTESPPGKASGVPVRTPVKKMEAAAKTDKAKQEKGASEDEGEMELTLTDAVQVALANNPDIEIAKHRIEQAQAGLREAESVFLPWLSADTTFEFGDAPAPFFMSRIESRKLNMRSNFNYPGTFTSFESGLTMQYNLFRWGRDVLQVKIAKEGIGASESGRKVVINELISGVIQTFYSYLETIEHINTAQKSVETVRRELEETRVREKHGAALRSDVLALEVRLAEANERLIRAQNAQKLALASLKKLLGVNESREIRLKDTGEIPLAVPDDFPVALAEALAHRPELVAVRRKLTIARMQKKQTETTFLPELDFTGRMYFDDPDMGYQSHRLNWLLGFTIRWSLFQGGRRLAQLSKAKAYIAEMKAEDRKTVLQIELDVRRAYLNLRAARERVRVAQASVAHAEENLALVKHQFDRGAATVTKYLDAEFALTAARSRLTSAQFDVKRSATEAARAMGWCADILNRQERNR